MATVSGGVVAHVRDGLEKRLATLTSHEAGTRDGTDPEDLHQMRVSVRRMRAMLRTARPFLDREQSEPLRAELGWLGKTMGPVRDLDVLFERLRAEAADLPEREAVDRLLAGLDSEYAAARQELLAALDSDRYQQLLSSLRQASRNLSGSKSDSDSELRTLVQRQFRKLRADVDELPDDPPDDQLHALRIRGKKLRYTAELAEPVLGKKIQRLLKATKRFQDVLGDHQDACVAEARLRELAARTDTEAAFVAGRLVEREEQRKHGLRQAWPKTWASLAKAAEKV